MFVFTNKETNVSVSKNVTMFPDFSHNLVVRSIIVADNDKGRC